MFQMPAGCSGKTLGPYIFAAEQAARGERDVAHHLGFHADARTAREQPVVRDRARASAGVTADDCR